MRIFFVAGILFQNCSHPVYPVSGNRFAEYADQLFDSTIEYYCLRERCLFNENYPEQ